MPLSHSLSFQSRVGPVTWLQPYTDDEIKKLAEEGVRNLIVVPISFVSEHLETLEEIDQEYREVAEEAGIRHWRRVPALNLDPRFLRDLADLVGDALQSVPVRVEEALDSSCCPALVRSVESALGFEVGGGEGKKGGRVVGVQKEMEEREMSLQR
eukprot:Cvel_23943.t1-p1 / transcript=Cvel_23943.t1 / gene=Cvel_23943 / organism=Chromera_velia_CCMP2878 / gene_product=Ferrochelatase, putative / transcript_product=Ferrochelatase, putative / location=Cvel_scaffold2530:25779-26872(-) / protein_length=154 / sequence_SO=supercontig / SO=protein_coding / is_pseudo=false